MTETSDVRDLITYYTKDMDPLLIKSAMRMIGGYTPEDRAKIIEWLIENRPKRYGLDIPAIKEAIDAARVSKNTTRWIDAVDWHCDACGVKFKYAEFVTFNDEIDRNIHDRCPQCGFCVSWTNDAREKLQRAGEKPDKLPEWYQTRRDHYQKKYGPPKPPVFNMQQHELWRTKNAAKLASL